MKRFLLSCLYLAVFIPAYIFFCCRDFVAYCYEELLSMCSDIKGKGKNEKS